MKHESVYDLGNRVKFYIFDPKILFEGTITVVHFYLDRDQETYNIKMSNGHINEGVSIDKITGKVK